MRGLWREELGHIDAERLVFVDEMGTHTSLAPLYAYAPIGERAFFEIPRNPGKNTTLLTSLHVEGMGPSMAVEGATTARVFETYVRAIVDPRPGARPGGGDGQPRSAPAEEGKGAHRGKRMRARLLACLLCPDLNPIEEALSKIKHLLRRIDARTKEVLVEAMGRALGAVSARDARGFFAHCGYRIPAQ